jgi:two-component system nitrate/nitrite response regulator NarL
MSKENDVMAGLDGLLSAEIPSSESPSLARIAFGPDADDQPTDFPRNTPRLARAASRSKHRHRQVSIVIIDQSALFRAGLKYVLPEDRFRVEASYPMLCELPPSALNDSQCLVLIGLDNAEADSPLSQIASFKAQHEVSRIIVLSEQFRREELLAAMEAGADGYLIKNEVTPEALVQTLELVLLGAMVIPQGFARLKGQAALEADRLALPEAVPEGIQPHLGNCVEQPAGFSRLSEREQMVLTQIRRGASNKHIARELNIAEATVKVHVKSLLRKLRVRNRTQAAMHGLALNLADGPTT